MYSATLESGTFWMYWNVTGSSISIALRCATEGWVGWGLSPDGGMAESDVLMAWVDGAGNGHVFDSWTDGYSGVASNFVTADPDRGGTDNLSGYAVLREVLVPTEAPSPAAVPTVAPSLFVNSTGGMLGTFSGSSTGGGGGGLAAWPYVMVALYVLAGVVFVCLAYFVGRRVRAALDRKRLVADSTTFNLI